MFINKFGLLNAKSEDIVSENTILYTVEYILLNKLNKNHPMFIHLVKYIESCKISPGLFNQNPEIFNNHDDYTSHDNLTAIVAFSHKYNLNYHKEIWIGMTSQMLIDSWGSPDDKNKSVGSWGTHEQWIYRKRNYYVYIENGIVSSYQEN